MSQWTQRVMARIRSRALPGRLALMGALIVALGCVGNARAASGVYDAFTDFTWTQNPAPGSPWSYGTKMVLTDPPTLYTEAGCLDYYPEVCGWVPYTPPNVIKNTSGQTVYLDGGLTVVPGAEYLNVHPGAGGVFTVVRWTAPTAETYDIKAAFMSAVLEARGWPTTTDVHVVLNGTAIFSGEVSAFYENGPQAEFATSVKLQQGDTVDFAVGAGAYGDYSGDGSLLKAAITATALRVPIDIKPHSRPNSINPYEGGVIKVAVLSTTTVKAADILIMTIRFGVTGSEAAPVATRLQDINGDGRLDLVSLFNVPETGIQCGDVRAILTGQVTSGRDIRGSDSIETVGCTRCVK
jgi:hypothetical protein